MADGPANSGVRAGRPAGALLTTGLYITALALIGAGVANALASATAGSPAAVRWRYSFIGSVFLHSVFPLLGMALASLTAAIRGHRGILRVLMVADLVLALVLLAGSGVFALDSLQLGSAVVPARKGGFWITVIRAEAYALGAALLLLILAFSSWKAQRAAVDKPRPEPTKRQDLLVSQRG
jgi:hypothetical protein